MLSYYNRYADLRSAFGTSSWKPFYFHYVECGKLEGRVAIGCDKLIDYVSSRSGADYASIYDGEYYLVNNPDLERFATVTIGLVSVVDDIRLLSHFVSDGMREGRQASSSFSVASYYNQYPDLRRAFGTSWESYYRHYLECGKAEGRAGSGCGKIEGVIASSDGVDYSAIYDGVYYAEHNVDVAAYASVKAGSDFVLVDSKLLGHFISDGMREGRQASSSFSVASYYNQYPDLRRAFGTSWESYYRHYLECGKAEGRAGVGCDELIPDDNAPSAIMGSSKTSVAQMTAFYNSKGKTYPARHYSSKGAPSIEVFSQLVLEEATAEGVRAEVLFCQAMKETGWLQFGGSVKAEQCNFGGLGATSPTVGGASFENVRKGLRAQVQHLKLYASTDPLVNDCIDPRWDNVISAYGRGCAPNLEDLNGKWAVPGDGYGESIYSMIQQMLTF
ncbi:glucosaminidase domain-containing protein [Gordonibacter sp. 28C]|uniref:glucosaminidase domain-containing protein n=1 Tax=Gordonibacter sp. 28C TaxID=2078569 RepID=UPI0013148FDA|nr:glucosaminidase domain-containing protein [Gordonibacter sp. 28C]